MLTAALGSMPMRLRPSLPLHGADLNERPAGSDHGNARKAEPADREGANSLVWLLPWILASIGFLVTLAILR
jgi:hypothetical protein